MSFLTFYAKDDKPNRGKHDKDKIVLITCRMGACVCDVMIAFESTARRTLDAGCNVTDGERARE